MVKCYSKTYFKRRYFFFLLDCVLNTFDHRIQSMEFFFFNLKGFTLPPPIHWISPKQEKRKEKKKEKGGKKNMAKEILFPHGPYGLIHKRTQSHFHHCHLPCSLCSEAWWAVLIWENHWASWKTRLSLIHCHLFLSHEDRWSISSWLVS